MNWQAISALAEAVAALGVILSLVYVGAQVRQGTLETRVGILRSVVNELGRVHDSLAQHGDLADIVVRGFGDYEALSVLERARMSSYLAHMFKLFEQLFLLRAGGAIDDADWRGFEHAIRDIAAYPGVRAWLGTRAEWFRPELLVFIGKLDSRPVTGNLFLERADAPNAAAAPGHSG